MSKDLVVFVDGPSSHTEHESFNWGQAALKAIDGWKRDADDGLYNWTPIIEGERTDALAST
jgi:hypothetical protein